MRKNIEDLTVTKLPTVIYTRGFDQYEKNRLILETARAAGSILKTYDCMEKCKSKTDKMDLANRMFLKILTTAASLQSWGLTVVLTEREVNEDDGTAESV